MKFNNRVNFGSAGKKEAGLDLHDFAGKIFTPFSDGFVVAGYSRLAHTKFVCKISEGQVYDDAFEPPREPLFSWLQAGDELFPDLKGKGNLVPVKANESFPEIKNLDQAVNFFGAASDAFLFFGYANGHREIKLYAEDPLMADAIGYLNALVMSCWGIKQAGEEEG